MFFLIGSVYDFSGTGLISGWFYGSYRFYFYECLDDYFYVYVYFCWLIVLFKLSWRDDFIGFVI